MTTGLLEAPWTGLGRLQSDVDNLSSRIQGKADSHEVYSLKSRLDSLERTVGEIRSLVDGFDYRLQATEDALRLMEETIA
ncbi:hypothetical protein LCGC14_2994850 [marine sediment metagenome]|uniref:Uncharacterized protein n=1 Tax=marine sediment metagenome TaxID=412755 RepID=A0A0F8X2T4_9ZZZZ